MQDAITLSARLDHFAAHAPPVPDWFEAERQARPPLPAVPAPDVQKVASILEDCDGEWPPEATMITAGGTTYGVTLDTIAAARAYNLARQKSRGEADAIDKANRLCKITAWAWAYARAMVSADAPFATVDPEDEVSTTPGIELVTSERLRQIYGEGFDAANDDKHSRNDHADAARCYLWAAVAFNDDEVSAAHKPPLWPWDAKWWKPTTRLRTLVKAAALAVAAIDREYRSVMAKGEDRA